MKRSARGFTLVEIMIVVAIIALLAAIAIPNVLRGRTTANETAAIGNLRALVSSLEMYRSTQAVYPAAWTSMYPGGGAPAYGPPSFQTGMNNTSGVQGYNYNYTQLTNATYNVLARPQVVNRTGTRAFYVDEAGTPRHCAGAGPAANTNNTIDAPPSSC